MIEFCSLFFYTYNREGVVSMKIVKNIVLSLCVILVLLVTLFSDRLIIFSSDLVYDLSQFSNGKVFKSGDKLEVKHNNSYCDYIYIRLEYVDPNGIEYFGFYDAANGVMLDGESFFTGSNKDAFTQDEVGTLPKVNGMEMEWTTEYYEDELYVVYCGVGAILKGQAYKTPEVKVECEDDEVKYKEKVKCSLSVDYSHTLSLLDFVIDSKDYIIGDIIPEEKWMTNRNGVIHNTPIALEEVNDVTKRLNSKVVTFTVTPKENKDLEIDNEAIHISDFEYKDVVKTSSLEDIYKPMSSKSVVKVVTTTKVSKDEEIENPETGVEDYLPYALCVACVSLLIISIIRRKEAFKKI